MIYRKISMAIPVRIQKLTNNIFRMRNHHTFIKKSRKMIAIWIHLASELHWRLSKIQRNQIQCQSMLTTPLSTVFKASLLEQKRRDANVDRIKKQEKLNGHISSNMTKIPNNSLKLVWNAHEYILCTLIIRTKLYQYTKNQISNI